MAKPWSMVVPVLNEAATIASFLESLQQFRGECEIIVVDGGSGDGSTELAQPWVDCVVSTAAGRASQMNTGARLAQGDWLIFVHADSRLSALPDSSRLAEASTQWGFYPVHFTATHLHYRVLAWFMNRRSRHTGVATGDQAMFVRRDCFQKQGGFADIPLMEDVELSKRLRSLSRPAIQHVTIGASTRRWQRHGFLRTVLTMWWLRLLYVLGVPPRRLAAMYYGGDW